MIAYATPEDYGRYADEVYDVAETAEVQHYLDIANELVAGACKHDRYATQANGLPKQEMYLSALHDATCMQVQIWRIAGVTVQDLYAGDVNAEGVVTSSKIGSGQVNIDNSKSIRAKSALINGQLHERPLRRLRRDGLASGVVA